MGFARACSRRPLARWSRASPALPSAAAGYPALPSALTLPSRIGFSPPSKLALCSYRRNFLEGGQPSMFKPLRRLICRHSFSWSERRQMEVCRKCGATRPTLAPRWIGTSPGVARHRKAFRRLWLSAEFRPAGPIGCRRAAEINLDPLASLEMTLVSNHAANARIGAGPPDRRTVPEDQDGGLLPWRLNAAARGRCARWRRPRPDEIVPGHAARLRRTASLANARVGGRSPSMLEAADQPGRLRPEVRPDRSEPLSARRPGPLLKGGEHANNRLISY